MQIERIETDLGAQLTPLPLLIAAYSKPVYFRIASTKQFLRLGCGYHPVFPQTQGFVIGRLDSSNPAFTLSVSACGRILATPNWPHAALPTGCVHNNISAIAKSVALIGFLLHLPTAICDHNSILPFHGARGSPKDSW